MRASKVLPLALLASYAFGAPLSRAATIRVLGKFDDLPSTSQDQMLCRPSITTAEIRARFRRFHPMREGEFESISYLQCGYQGTVRVGDWTFTWKSYAGELMETTYPDGKLHRLAGKADKQN